MKSEILDNFISKSIFNYKNSKPMRQTETQVVCMVLRGRIRSQSLKSWEPCLFPYKEELSAGKMEFIAAEDTDLQNILATWCEELTHWKKILNGKD